MKFHEEIEIGGKTLSISTGHIAKQADGAVTVRYGDTIVLVTACAQKEANKGAGFLPLTVDYREYTFSAGKIPGGFFRREGRPSEGEILVCRLTDRALRPLFPDGYYNETQVIGSVLSHDILNDPDILNLVGASTALTISAIPYNVPIGAVRIGMINDQLVVNPTTEELAESRLDLVVASSEQAILMVEAGAKEVEEDVILQALELGFKEAQPIIQAQRKLAEKIGAEKWTSEPKQIPEEIYNSVSEKIGDNMEKALSIKGKIERRDRLDEIKEGILEDYPEESEERLVAAEAFGEIKKQVFREGVFNKKQRFDGRNFDEIRAVSCEVDFLPRTHGSAIFTRGETQSLVTTTLGAKSDAQIMDELGGEWKRRFMLHYNFPPFSVGEVKFMRGPSRREIGHGALAQKALYPILPGEEEFPYTLRIVSDIMESNGSSSMATVCGGSLALFAAGVPVKASVAGIAMGLLKEEDDVIILSDIAGEEDHYGDMDFKVAGTKNGVTALQMDIKISGVTTEILHQALAQAKAGREYILGIMDSVIAEPRAELSPFAPRLISMKVDPEKIRDIIGKGGNVIRKIVEESKAEVDIEDDGTVLIYSPNKEALDKAKQMIEEIIEEPEVGKVYLGKVVSILDFGAFVQILPSTQGLLHISEIANYRVNQVTDELQVGEEIKVKVIEIDKTSGKVRLSRKALFEESAAKSGTGPKGGEGSGREGGSGGRRGNYQRQSSRGRGRSGGGRRSGGGGGYNSRSSSQGNRDSAQSGPRYRSRKGPQYGNRQSEPDRGGQKNRGGKNRGGSGFQSNSDHPIRFPGNLGPNPFGPGGMGGKKKKY